MLGMPVASSHKYTGCLPDALQCPYMSLPKHRMPLSRRQSRMQLPLSPQPTPSTSPQNSVSSSDTLAEDDHGELWRSPPTRPSTRPGDVLGDLNDMSDVPIPWSESNECATFQSQFSNRQSRDDVQDAAVDHDFLWEESFSRASHSSRATSDEESVVSAHSPAVTNITLETATSPPPAQRDLLGDESFTSKRRHSQFYLEDTLVVIEVDVFASFPLQYSDQNELKVEGCLFKVNRYLLNRESIYLQNIFALDRTAGTCDENAIMLLNITVHGFECFLYFLFFG